MDRRILYIDVFSDAGFAGNPVAVIIDGDGLSQEEMQKIASWTNLSETTFICKAQNPKADYCLKIFTPRSELPFAGHPTVGSAYAAIKAQLVETGKTKLIQECKVGLVEINIGENIEFMLPAASFTDLDEASKKSLESLLNCEIQGRPQIVNVGPKWIIANLNQAKEVIDCKPNFSQMKALEQSLGATGVTIFGFHQNDDALIEVRSFAPSDNIDEDPVCGSGNGSVCAYMLENGLIGKDTKYIAKQGRVLGRNGKVNARINKDGQIFIGGQCTLGVEGKLLF